MRNNINSFNNFLSGRGQESLFELKVRKVKFLDKVIWVIIIFSEENVFIKRRVRTKMLTNKVKRRL